MASPSGVSEIIVEVLLELEDCQLSEALLRSLIPESNLRLRGVSFEVSRVDCGIKLVFKGSEPRALIPSFSNSLRLASMVIEVLRGLAESSE